MFFCHDTSSPLRPPVFPLLSSDLWSCYAGRASLLPTWKCHPNRAHGDTDLWRHLIRGPMLPRWTSALTCSTVNKVSLRGDFSASLHQGLFYFVSDQPRYFPLTVNCTVKTPQRNCAHSRRTEPLQLCVPLLLTVTSSVTPSLPSRAPCLFSLAWWHQGWAAVICFGWVSAQRWHAVCVILLSNLWKSAA